MRGDACLRHASTTRTPEPHSLASPPLPELTPRKTSLSPIVARMGWWWWRGSLVLSVLACLLAPSLADSSLYPNSAAGQKNGIINNNINSNAINNNDNNNNVVTNRDVGRNSDLPGGREKDLRERRVETQRLEDIQRQLDQHDQLMARKEQEVAEREKQRQEQQRRLDMKNLRQREAEEKDRLLQVQLRQHEQQHQQKPVEKPYVKNMKYLAQPQETQAMVQNEENRANNVADARLETGGHLKESAFFSEKLKFEARAPKKHLVVSRSPQGHELHLNGRDNVGVGQDLPSDRVHQGHKLEHTDNGGVQSHDEVKGNPANANGLKIGRNDLPQVDSGNPKIEHPVKIHNVDSLSNDNPPNRDNFNGNINNNNINNNIDRINIQHNRDNIDNINRDVNNINSNININNNAINNNFVNNNDINSNDQVNRNNDINNNMQPEANPNSNNHAGNHRGHDPQVGGLHLSWDWEDFSIMFNNYGGAEMKVRRAPHPTTGEPWPMPQYYSKKDSKVYKVARDLRFVPTGVKCDILEEALARHLQRVLRGAVEDMYDNLQNAEGTFVDDPTLRYEKEAFLRAPTISRVEVKVRKACSKYPTLESDESYDLVVKKKKTYVWANEVWGALRGLETFGHLVWRGTDGLLYIKETVVSDYPRFAHRGLHIDTSRHFLFKEIILDILESMEMNKLNVFHWHIVDDQSFPYESKVYPELSRKGAFHPSYVYTLEDIAEIIEYARVRGIRVLPEFDTPGHTYSWGLSRPELLTQCYTGSTPVHGYLGPIDPSKDSTYRFLQTLFQEIMDVFKDPYLHLGGDEVPLGCWQSNPEIMAFAEELTKKAQVQSPKTAQPQQNYYNSNFGWNNMWSEDIKQVYMYYVNRLIKLVSDIGQKRKKGVKYIMWQEVMNNNLQLPNDTIIQVWMGDMGDVMRATSLGYHVLYSTCWYLDHIEYGTKWPKYYTCDPVDQSYGYRIDEKKVLGGEVAFWSEYFSNENLIPLMWPRASAAAERLWSSKEVKNLDKAAERLSEHRCRMIKRGVNAGEISGPGYCLHAPPKRRLFNETLGCKGGNCSRTHNIVQIEDIELHLSHRGTSLSECGNMFSGGSSSSILLLLSLSFLMVLVLFALSRSSTRLQRSRVCRNRSILVVFALVLLVYFLCYTTIWIRAFEFSGTFHKTLQEENHSAREAGGGGSDDNDNANSYIRPMNS